MASVINISPEVLRSGQTATNSAANGLQRLSQGLRISSNADPAAASAASDRMRQLMAAQDIKPNEAVGRVDISPEARQQLAVSAKATVSAEAADKPTASGNPSWQRMIQQYLRISSGT